MENKKDIGLAFKEKLNQLKQTPNDAVWQSINNDLDKKRRKRFAFYFISGLAGLAVVWLGLFLADDYSDAVKSGVPTSVITKKINVSDNELTVLEQQTDTVFKNKNIRKSKTTTSKKLIQSTAEMDEYEVVTRYKVYVKKRKTATTIRKKVSGKASEKTIKKPTKTTKSRTISVIKNNISSGLKRTKKYSKKNLDLQKLQKSKTIALTKNTSKTKQLKGQNDSEQNKNSNQNGEQELSNAASKNILALEGSLIKNDTTAIDSASVAKIFTDSIPKKQKKLPKPYVEKQQESMKNDQIFISIFAGPAYYNAFSKSSAVTNSGDFDTKGSLNLNFGLYVRAMYSNELGLRLGVVKTDLKYTTTIANGGDNYWTLSRTTLVNQPVDKEAFNAHFSGKQKIDLIQEMAYLEFPLEAYYVFPGEKATGFDGFAGFSTYFLTRNEVFAKASGVGDLEIGAVSNMNKVVFSLNVGTIWHYDLNEHFRIEAMPFLKYQMKAATGFSPFLFSIQAGLTYKL